MSANFVNVLRRLSCCMLLTAWCWTAILGAHAEPLQGFVTAQGNKLMVGDEEYRFMSFNIPNLHLVEDNFSFENPNPWRWPNEFEIRDGLESIRQLGSRATRIYVLSVAREGSDMGDHVFVRGPGDFNEQAYRVLDKVLQIANETGVRVLIPLVDNWQWWGGRAEYAKFRGKSPDEFWTDDQILADFKQTIHYTLNRVNTYTGVAYKDDPAIFGWETGNELDSPPEWTRKVSAYIKSIDPNHLVVDGYSLHGVRQESLDDPNIDVITTHHYPNTDTNYVEAITEAHEKIAGRKPYFVGEFGFATSEELTEVMDLIIDKGISGGMLWSLRVHNRDGGFYWHSEPSGGNLYKAYHWPGFASGNAYQEQQLLHSVQEKAFQIRELEVPTPDLPRPPRLFEFSEVSEISWQGSTGASAYDVERATSTNGPWQVVGKDVSDATVQYRPLFNDETATVGASYYYRVRAENSAGMSQPSNVVGPVTVEQFTLVDECRHFGKLHEKSGNLKLITSQARRTQEDSHRIELPAPGHLVYQTSEPIQQFQVLMFNEDGTSAPVVSSSVDGQQYQPCIVTTTPIETGEGDYGYLSPLKLSGTPQQSNARFLKIESSSGTTSQLSRIEIASGSSSSRQARTVSTASRGAQLNPSILMFHKPYHVDGVKYIQRAADLGCQKVNVVLTLLCQIDERNEVINFGIHSGRRYRPLTEPLLQDFKSAVQEVFAAAAAHDLQLSVLLHLNAAGPRYEWRNHFLMDPLAYYQGFSFQDTIVAAVTEALAATPQLNSPVEIALAGEMGRSVFSYPASYGKLVEQLRDAPNLPDLHLGLSFNFNSVADNLELSASQRKQMQQLIDRCDFVGMSNYRPLELPVEPDDFAAATHTFLSEMKNNGVTVPAHMPLHFSEVGIGGGKGDGLAQTPAEAALTPWEGSGHPRRNPWVNAEMKTFRAEYHRALLEFLANPSDTNPVTDAFLWSEGSWDPQGIIDRGFAAPPIIRMIQQHNRKVGL